MYDHVDRSFHLMNSQFTLGDNDFNRPFNNVILPIRAVNVRSEGFDVKDVEVYVNDKDNYHKSFLTRKYHSRWAKKYSLDTAIDESVESHFDYGLVLVKNVNERRPEIVQPQEIAFCDTVDVLAGPICLKHELSISEMLEMKGKWKNEEIDRAIRSARFVTQDKDGKSVQTPGKKIQVYELHGTFPDTWLTDGVQEDTGTYSPQVHILTYYTDQETGNRFGITLFSGKEPKPIFKALKRDAVFGRACGRGGIEELFHAQIWTNYSEIHLQQILEAVSKVITKTTDAKLAKNNNTKNIKHGQIVHVEEGKTWDQMIIQAPNKTAFDNYVNKWEQVARVTGSASDPQLGLNPTSGTPLGTTEIVTSQGQGIHEYRRGKLATFWGEIYRDWILPKLVQDMLAGDEWVEELSVDELREIANLVLTKKANERFKKSILSGKPVSKEDQDEFKRVFLETFAKGGQKRFLELVKDEIKDIPIDVEFNIAGKQAYQAEMVNKLNSIFRAVFANPAMLQNEGVAELFNNILESSGISPIKFSTSVQQQNVESQPNVQTNPQPELAIAQPA